MSLAVARDLALERVILPADADAPLKPQHANMDYGGLTARERQTATLITQANPTVRWPPRWTVGVGPRRDLRDTHPQQAGLRFAGSGVRRLGGRDGAGDEQRLTPAAARCRLLAAPAGRGLFVGPICRGGPTRLSGFPRHGRARQTLSCPCLSGRPKNHSRADRSKSVCPFLSCRANLPDGLAIPVNDVGEGICLNVVGDNAQDGVTWIHSYVTGDKKQTFCIYDAPSPESIRQAAQRNNLPVDRITPSEGARPILV